MEYDDIYLTEVLYPYEFTMTTEIGTIEYYLCRRKDDTFIDIKSNKKYTDNDIIGNVKVVGYEKLSDYYNKFGFIRRKNNLERQKVKKIVRSYKRNM